MSIVLFLPTRHIKSLSRISFLVERSIFCVGKVCGGGNRGGNGSGGSDSGYLVGLQCLITAALNSTFIQPLLNVKYLIVILTLCNGSVHIG